MCFITAFKSYRKHFYVVLYYFHKCPFSARCPMVNARAKKFLNGQCPLLPVPRNPKRALPESARAKKFCPLTITTVQFGLVRVAKLKWFGSVQFGLFGYKLARAWNLKYF